MKLRVRGLVGVDKAEINIGGISLICGPTGAGKSTMADAAKAILTAEPLMRGVSRKADLHLLLRTGVETGSAVMDYGSSTAALLYPKGGYTTEGDVPATHPICAGAIRFGELPPKEKMAVIQDVMQSLPTKDDLRTALPNTPQNVLDKLWQHIETQGWDNAHKIVREEAAKAKGVWEAKTGDRYGSAKAKKLAEDSKETITEGEIERASSEAQGRWEIVKKAQSKTSAEELAALNEDAAAQETRLSDVTDLEKKSKAADDARNKALATLSMAPPPDKSKEVLVSCPHCGAMSVLQVDRKNPGEVHYSLSTEDGEKLEDRKKKQRKAFDDAKRAADDASDNATDMAHRLFEARRLYEKSCEAKERLLVVSSADDSEPIENLINAAKQADERVARLKNTKEANSAQRRVEVFEEILGHLAIDGLRASILQKGLGDLNDLLAKIAATMKENGTYIDEAFTYWFRARPYNLLSRGEKIVADAIFQIACALNTNSVMIVVDDADAIQGELRSGLLAAIHKHKVTAMVCVAAAAKKSIPDMKKMSAGTSYWIEDGTVEEI